jgi:uncharacterized membrane protein YsdA (DUF1294 family)
MNTMDYAVLAWIGLASLLTFLTFGFDKWRAKRSGSRVSELKLALMGAAGGWPGGLLGMWLFRHKSAKALFQLKFAAAFVAFAGSVAAYLYWRSNGW